MKTIKTKKKFKHNLKNKSFLILATTISITIFITYSVLYTFYYNYHAKHVTKELLPLMQAINSDFDRINEIIESIKRNADITLHVFNNVEELMEDFPLETNRQEIFSKDDLEQLANGELVINLMEITIDLPEEKVFHTLTFTQPVVENNTVKKIIFMHNPISKMPRESMILLVLSCTFTIIAAGVTFLLAKRFLGKSYHQLQDIKQAAINVSNGNYDAYIHNQTDDEVGEISEVFNMMANALKDEQQRIRIFSQDISHEIRAPLTYIKAYNQALMDGIVCTPNDRMKYHQIIDRETIRLQKFIQNVLDFAKLGANIVELEKQPLVFAQSIEDIMLKYEPIFKEKQIQYNLQLDYDVIIEGDEERIEQIIQNIIQNAIRYSKDQPRIDLTLTQQETTCLLTIADNGIGIREEHLAIITNRFVRVNKVKSCHESGTGIGLSIVESLMELHGGELKIESQLGVGTTIKLLFPLYKID